MSNNTCPLCSHLCCNLYHRDKRRSYHQCSRCQLVFADRNSVLSAKDELAQYQLHNNDLNDDGYRQFLLRLATPLLAALPASGLQGLDFGCGPGPLLAQMLSDAGQHMAVWDPYFAADNSVLQQQYDFISCTEAVEHFVNPAREWALWLKLLKPGGTLAIMTKRYTTAEAFASWHYKLDPTHVSFFCEHTFSYLAQRDSFDLHFVEKDVVLLQRRKH
ncbi:class I SAM-dependent methyltransferase [Rheinheimera maricola]|uniref:Class I SAM-dependent methyltransferase n=1 Tax=Rheinheimera maricola TaxID=2793282 RepID=A0ABS7XED7_9GAMM|nr:class I SAM-dependent methyltransferase [Rheinheimera maricola]MBZ9613122.1 class I SAM-dependent methyltransferase [Rheinheimera maricola]